MSDCLLSAGNGVARALRLPVTSYHYAPAYLIYVTLLQCSPDKYPALTAAYIYMHAICCYSLLDRQISLKVILPLPMYAYYVQNAGWCSWYRPAQPTGSWAIRTLDYWEMRTLRPHFMLPTLFLKRLRWLSSSHLQAPNAARTAIMHDSWQSAFES